MRLGIGVGFLVRGSGAAPVDVTAPTILSTSPSDNATGVSITASPTITFSETVVFGTGLITLRENNGGWSDLETFDVTTEVGTGNGQVSISGAVLTINPTTDLSYSREIAIRVDATAIDDLSGNSFAGIADDTTIRFTTEAGAGAAPVITGTPLLTDNEISVDGTLPMTFYYTNTSSGTPPSAATIKAAPDSRSLSSGANSLTGLTQEVTAGTWYFHYLVGNAYGDSATETESYVRTVPGTFGTGDWSVANPATDGDINITISTLPSAGTSAISALQYQIDGGSWTSLGGTTTGTYGVAGLTNDVEVDVAVRAVSAAGNGTASATKPVTPTAAASLQYVGGKTWTTTGTGSATSVSLTDLTGGLAAAPADGDLVIVAYTVSGNGDPDRDVTVATGYTEVADLYSNAFLETNFGVFYKRMTSTPDTTVDLGTTFGGGVYGGAAAIHVWRGVSASTPMDVTATTATGSTTSKPDAASITPTTSGAVIIVAGGGVTNLTGSYPYTASELSNFITAHVDSVIDATVGMGSYAWTSGAFNPAAWTGGADDTNHTWCAVTLALRPA